MDPGTDPTSLNDDRKPIRLTITNPHRYGGPVWVTIILSYLLYLAISDGSPLKDTLNSSLHIYIATGLVVILIVCYYWLTYSKNRAAQDQEVRDAFYKQLTAYLKKYPEHHEYVDQFWHKGMITLREAKLLADTLNHLQDELHPHSEAKNELKLRMHARTPLPVASQPSTHSEQVSR